MGNKRFSVTTYALVGISLVALYFVGKSVNPPPAAPPAPVKPAKAPAKPSAPTPAQNEQSNKAAEEHQKELARLHAEQERRKATEAHAVASGKPVAQFNPNQIQTDTDYWHQNQMGRQGEADMAVKLAEAQKAAKPIVPAKPPASSINAPSGSAP